MKCIIYIFLILSTSLYMPIIQAQEYSKREIRTTIKNAVKAIDKIQTLKYTLDYSYLSYYDKKSDDKQYYHKECVGITRLEDSNDEIGAFFNLHIAYNDSTMKEVIFDGSHFYNYIINGKDTGKVVINTDKEGYQLIMGSDVPGLLYHHIIEGIHGLNSLSARILVDELLMKDILYSGKSCYMVSVHYKNIQGDNRMHDVVNTYYIDKSTYLPLMYRFQGKWQGLSTKETYKIQYDAINPILKNSVFNIDTTINPRYNLRAQKTQEEKAEVKFLLDKILHASIPLARGDTIKLSQQKSQLIILDFWYRRCPPCIKLMPEINKLYKEYRDEGVLVIGINDRDTKNSVHQLHKLKGYSYPTSYKNSINFSQVTGVSAYPTTIILNKDGQVIKSFVGYSRLVSYKIKKIIEAELEK